MNACEAFALNATHQDIATPHFRTFDLKRAASRISWTSCVAAAHHACEG